MAALIPRVATRVIQWQPRAAARRHQGLQEIRTLVRGLPSSADRLARALHDASDQDRFSAFDLLSTVAAARPDIAASVANLVSQFLIRCRDNNESAAWMASELLGRHATAELGARGLLTALETGRFPAGRLFAVFGIWKLLARPDAAQKRPLQDAVRRAAKNDSSARVRIVASAVVGTFATRRADAPPSLGAPRSPSYGGPSSLGGRGHLRSRLGRQRPAP